MTPPNGLYGLTISTYWHPPRRQKLLENICSAHVVILSSQFVELYRRPLERCGVGPAAPLLRKTRTIMHTLAACFGSREIVAYALKIRQATCFL